VLDSHGGINTLTRSRNVNADLADAEQPWSSVRGPLEYQMPTVVSLQGMLLGVNIAQVQ